MFGEDLLITICGIIIIILIALILALPIIIIEHKIRKLKKQNPNLTDLDVLDEFF